MRVTQALIRNVQQRGARAASVCQGRTRSWQEFASRVARYAGALRALGVNDGERVAVLALNSDRYLETFYAVPWAGGIVVPINTRWAAAEIAYALTDAGVSVLAVDPDFLGLAREILGGLATPPSLILLADAATDGMPSVEALIDAHAAVEESPRAGDDVSGIFYTGGTTGRSKGVMLTHANHVTNSVQLAAMMNTPAEPSYLHAAPMFHIADALCVYMITMLGGTHVVVPRFEPADCARALAEHEISDILLVPTMIQMLLDHLDQAPRRLPALKRLYYGASPIPEATLYRLFDALPDTQPVQLYGQTEAAPMITLLDGKYHVKSGPHAGRLRSAGRALPCIEVRIVDEQDRELPRGEIGEVVARGPNVMKGYWQMPEQTASTLRGGWLHTGDAAWMDEEGFIFITDRLKDMIISGGENVYSTEVENALYQHPAVAQCAVIGVPDQRWGERVHAVVVPRPGAERDAAALMAHCRTLIADFKCPRSVEFRDSPLPVSGAGKILKTELRKPHWEGISRGVN